MFFVVGIDFDFEWVENDDLGRHLLVARDQLMVRKWAVEFGASKAQKFEYFLIKIDGFILYFQTTSLS